MPTIVSISPELLKLPDQVRLATSEAFSDEQLRPLGESMRVRQLQPVGARPDRTALWGFRRIRAALLVGLKSVDTIITEEPLTETQVKLLQLAENVHRADLTGYEKWKACAELMCMNPGWQQKDLAAHLNVDPGMATRLLSPSRCHPSVQEALAAGKIGISACYEISKLPEGEQGELLTVKLKGASRDEIAHQGRKKRNGCNTGGKMGKVNIPLASGAKLTIAGCDLGMPEVVVILSDVLREARKASEQYDVKTWVAMMKDKARN